MHFFKYSRALAARTGCAPEAVLKTTEFAALMPRLILGERASAQLVLNLLQKRLLEDADIHRAQVPYWDDLIAYQSVFFLSDAAPPPQSAAERVQFPARAESAILLDFQWDLPTVLPLLLRPFTELPIPSRRSLTLLFARSPQGEVTVLRSTDALKQILTRLSGREDPAQIAAQLNLDPAAMAKAMKRLEEIGAVVAQESFSASHVGSDLPPSSAVKTA